MLGRQQPRIASLMAKIRALVSNFFTLATKKFFFLNFIRDERNFSTVLISIQLCSKT